MPKKVRSSSKSTGHNLANALGKNLDMLASILPPDQFERLKNAANAARAGSSNNNNNNSPTAATPIVGVATSVDGSTAALSTSPTTPTDGGAGTCFSSTFSRLNVDGPLTSAHLEAHNNKGSPTTKDEVVQQHQSSQDVRRFGGEYGDVQLLLPTDISMFKGGANATEPPLGAVAMVSPMLRARHHDPADIPCPPPLALSKPSPHAAASDGCSTPASPNAVAATPTPGTVARFPSSNCPFGSTEVFPTRGADGMAVGDSRRGSTASIGYFDPPFHQMESMDASESFAYTMRPTVGYVDARSMLSSRSRGNSVSREPSPIADANFDANSTLLAACETSAFALATTDRGTIMGHRRSGTVAPPSSEGADHAFRQPNPLDADCFRTELFSNDTLIHSITSGFQHANDNATSNVDAVAPFLSFDDTQRLVSLVAEVRGALAPSAKVHWIDVSLRDKTPHSPFFGNTIPCTAHEVSQWEPSAPDYPCNERLKAAEAGQVFKRLEKALATSDVETAKGIFLRFPEVDVLEGYNVIMDKGISALYDGSRTQRVGGGLLPPWHSSEQQTPLAPATGDAVPAPKKKMKEVLPPEMDIFSGKSERGTASWLVEAINGRRDGVLELLLWQFERSLPQPVDMLPPLPPLPHPSVIASSASLMCSSFGTNIDAFATSSNRGSEVTSPIHHQTTSTVYIPRLDIDAFAKLQCYNRRRRKQLSGILHAARVYGLANFKITEEALALTAVHVTISPLMRLPGDALTDEQILACEEGRESSSTAALVPDAEGVPLYTDAERIVDKTLEFIGEFADYEKGLFGCCYGFDEDGEETFQDVESNLLAGSSVLHDGGDLQAVDGDVASSVPSGILPSTLLSSPRNNSSGEFFSHINNHNNHHVSFSENNSPVPAFNTTRSRSPSVSLMGGAGVGGVDYPATLLAFAMHYLGLTPSPIPSSSSNATSPPNRHQHTFAISYQTLVNVLEAVDANTLALIEQERSELEKEHQQHTPSSKSSRAKAKEAAAAEGMKHPHDIWFPGLTSSCFWDRFPDTASLDFYLGQRLEVFLTVLRLQQIWYEQETYEQQHFNHGEGVSDLPSNDDILKAGSDDHNSSSFHNTPTPQVSEASPPRRQSVSPARKLSVFGSPMSPRRFSVTPTALSPVTQSLSPRGCSAGGGLRRSESMHSIQSNTTSIANASFTSYSVVTPVAVLSRRPQLSALSMGTMDQHMKALKLEEAIERIRSRKREKKGKSSKNKSIKEQDEEDEIPLHPDDVRKVTMRIASSVALSDLEASTVNSLFLGGVSVSASSRHGNSLFCNSMAGAMLTSGTSTACASPLFASRGGGSSITTGSPVMVPAAPPPGLVSMSAAVIDAVERRHYKNILLKDDIQTLRNRLMATFKEETTIVSEKQPVLTGGKAGDGDESEVSLPPSFDMEVMNMRSVEYVRQYVPPVAVTTAALTRGGAY